MTEGEIAGRLVVPVESSTKGFKQKLKEKIEAASKNLAVEVGVEVDAKGLRKDLEKKVRKASKGVKVTIGVDLDAKDLPAKVRAIAEAAEAKVRVTTDGSGLADDVAKDTAAAEATAGKNPVKVGLRARMGLWLEALRERNKAQAAVDAKPIAVPVRLKMPRTRGLLRGALYTGIASIIQPAVGAIGQAVGGLSAMAGAIAPAVGTLAAAPVAISALITGLIGVTTASQGVGDAIGVLNEKQKALASGAEWSADQQAKLKAAMDRLSPSAQKFARRLVGLKDDWTSMARRIQEPLFEPLARQIEPLAKSLLPTLEKSLYGTAEAVGRVADRTADWMQTGLFRSNFAGVMRQNNRTVEAGGDALRNFFAGYLEFQRAAAPFQRGFDRWMRSTGRWFNDTMRENRLDGSTAAFLDKAVKRLQLTWSIVKEFSGGIAGIFRAGDESGKRLLTTFESFLSRWHEWVDSTEGQNRLSTWFEATETGFIEMSRLVNDTFKAIAKWAEDPKIAGMINTIRTKFGPALNDFLITFADAMGENTINLLTELARGLNNLAPGIEVLTDLTGAFIDAAAGVNTFMESTPRLSETLVQIGAGMLVLSKGRKALGVLAALTGGKFAGKAAGKAAGKRAAAASGGGLLSSLLGGAAAGAGGTAAVKGGKHALSRGAVLRGGAKGLAKRWGPLAAILAGIELENIGDTTVKLTELQESIAKFGNTRSVGGAFKDLLHDGENLNEFFTQGRDNLDDWFNTLRDGISPTQGYRDRLLQLDDALKNLFTAAPRDAAKAYGKLLEESGISAKDLAKLLPEAAAAMEKYRKEAELRGAKKGNFFDGVFKGAAKEAADLKRAIQGLPKAVRTQIQTPGVVKSIGYVKVLADQYNLTPKQVITTLAATGVVKTVRDVKVAQKQFDLTPKQVVTLIKTAGVQPTLGQIAGLHKQYKLTPAQVVTLLKATGIDFALGQTRGLQRQYGLTPEQVLTLLKAQDLASGVANRVKGIYSGIPRTIYTQIITNHVDKFERMARRAGGGHVRGPGTETSDSIPALLSDNEFVIKAKSVKKYGLDMLNAINAGRFADGGLVSRFRNGGHAKADRKGDRKAPKWLNGLRDLLLGSFKEIERAQRRLIDHTGRSFKKQIGRLERIERRRAQVRRKLAQSRGWRAEARDLRDGLIDGGEQSGSLVGIANANSGFLTAGFAAGELRRKIADTRAFKAALATLRRRGLSKRGYKQLAEAGVEEGGIVAQQLLEAGPKQIKLLNQLQRRLASTAKGLGDSTMKVLAGAGTQASLGFIRGLASQNKQMTQTAKHLADSFVKQIKKRLRIKSPSRVTEELGEFTGEGFNVGLLKKKARLSKTAQDISGMLARDLVPSTHAATLHSATRKGAAVAYGSNNRDGVLAPLVGQLVINGETQKQVRDGLEEAMIALRRIRQGGVYADRTS